jgi:hypothetical protein
MAMLSGEPIELVRFVVAASDGEVRFGTYATPDHANRRFMIDVARTAERHFPELEPYANRDRVFFSIPITVRQMDGGGWDWRENVDIFGSVLEACGVEVARIALEIGDEILPIVVAAADAGEFP